MGRKPDLWWADKIRHYGEETLKWGLSGAGGAAGFVVGAGGTAPTGPGAVAGGIAGAGVGASAGWGIAEGIIYGIDRGMKGLAEWVEGTPARMRRERLRWEAQARLPQRPRLQPKVEQGIQVDEHTIYWPKRNLTQITKPFVIDLRDEVIERVPKPLPSPRRRSRIIRTPPIHIEGRIPSTDSPLKKADWMLRHGSEPMGAGTSAYKPFRSVVDLPDDMHNLRLGRSSVGARVPSLSDKGLGTGVGSLHEGSIFNRPGGALSRVWNAGCGLSGGTTWSASPAPTRSNAFTSLTASGFSARSSAGFSPALEGLQDRLSHLSGSLETPMLSSGRSSIAGALSGVGDYGSGFGAQGFGSNLRLNVPGLGGYGSGFGAQGFGPNLRLNVPGLGGGGTGPSLLPPGSLSRYARGF